jgi:hypothetical protein
VCDFERTAYFYNGASEFVVVEVAFDHHPSVTPSYRRVAHMSVEGEANSAAEYAGQNQGGWA